IVAVVLFDPVLNLLLERIEFGMPVGSRMRHGHQLRMTQILAHRIPGELELNRDLLNRFALCFKFMYRIHSPAPDHGSLLEECSTTFPLEYRLIRGRSILSWRSPRSIIPWR